MFVTNLTIQSQGKPPGGINQRKEVYKFNNFFNKIIIPKKSIFAKVCLTGVWVWCGGKLPAISSLWAQQQKQHHDAFIEQNFANFLKNKQWHQPTICHWHSVYDERNFPFFRKWKSVTVVLMKYKSLGFSP